VHAPPNAPTLALDGPGSPEQPGEFYAGPALKMVMNTVPPEGAAVRSAGRGNGRTSGRPRIAAGKYRREHPPGVAITLI
jgi:hypothetical protein